MMGETSETVVGAEAQVFFLLEYLCHLRPGASVPPKLAKAAQLSDLVFLGQM